MGFRLETMTPAARDANSVDLVVVNAPTRRFAFQLLQPPTRHVATRRSPVSNDLSDCSRSTPLLLEWVHRPLHPGAEIVSWRQSRHTSKRTENEPEPSIRNRPGKEAGEEQAV